MNWPVTTGWAKSGLGHFPSVDVSETQRLLVCGVGQLRPGRLGAPELAAGARDEFDAIAPGPLSRRPCETRAVGGDRRALNRRDRRRVLVGGAEVPHHLAAVAARAASADALHRPRHRRPLLPPFGHGRFRRAALAADRRLGPGREPLLRPDAEERQRRRAVDRDRQPVAGVEQVLDLRRPDLAGRRAEFYPAPEVHHHRRRPRIAAGRKCSRDIIVASAQIMPMAPSSSGTKTALDGGQRVT